MEYGLISDTHYHGWSAFSQIDEHGINTRLLIQLRETERAAEEMQEAGLKWMIHAGDTFHVRGSLAPSVLNSVIETYRAIVDSGLDVVMIAGNHDLEGKESAIMTNAITALKDVGVLVVNKPTEIKALGVVLIPWVSSMTNLQDEIIKVVKKGGHGATDLILHAPINGVIKGIPDHGLTPEWLGEQGFRRVFAGHYHNHKDFGNNVYSVGALTHQTWSDVGTKAGFLLVTDKSVNYRASRAPSFIDLPPDTDPAHVPLLVDGNYVRVVMEIEKESEVKEMREWLESCNAAGVVIHPVKSSAVTARTGATVKTGASMSESIMEFIKLKSYANPKPLGVLCEEIMKKAEATDGIA